MRFLRPRTANQTGYEQVQHVFFYLTPSLFLIELRHLIQKECRKHLLFLPLQPVSTTLSLSKPHRGKTQFKAKLLIICRFFTFFSIPPSSSVYSTDHSDAQRQKYQRIGFLTRHTPASERPQIKASRTTPSCLPQCIPDRPGQSAPIVRAVPVEANGQWPETPPQWGWVGVACLLAWTRCTFLFFTGLCHQTLSSRKLSQSKGFLKSTICIEELVCLMYNVLQMTVWECIVWVIKGFI